MLLPHEQRHEASRGPPLLAPRDAGRLPAPAPVPPRHATRRGRRSPNWSSSKEPDHRRGVAADLSLNFQERSEASPLSTRAHGAMARGNRSRPWPASKWHPLGGGRRTCTLQNWSVPLHRSEWALPDWGPLGTALHRAATFGPRRFNGGANRVRGRRALSLRCATGYAGKSVGLRPGPTTTVEAPSGAEAIPPHRAHVRRLCACSRSPRGIGADAVGFVTSLNLHRRHLTEPQRATVAAKLTNLEQGDNQHASGWANLHSWRQPRWRPT